MLEIQRHFCFFLHILQYRFNFETGNWTHRTQNHPAKGLGYQSLYDITYDEGIFELKNENQHTYKRELTSRVGHYIHLCCYLFIIY